MGACAHKTISADDITAPHTPPGTQWWRSVVALHVKSNSPAAKTRSFSHPNEQLQPPKLAMAPVGAPPRQLPRSRRRPS